MNQITKTCLNILKYQPCRSRFLKDVINLTNQDANMVRTSTYMSSNHQPIQQIQIEQKYFSTLQSGFDNKMAYIEQRGISNQPTLHFTERKEFKVSLRNCHKNAIVWKLIRGKLIANT